MRKYRIAMQMLVVAALAGAHAWMRLPLYSQSAPPSTSSVQSPTLAPSARSTFQSSDLYRQKSVGDVQMSSDGKRIAYSVQNSDRPGRPYSQVWILDVATGKAVRLGSDTEGASG